MNVEFKVDFIKIDTEGGEIDILKGSNNLVTRDLPIISVEYGPGGYDAYGYDPDTLFTWARSHDYWIFDLFGHQFRSIEQWNKCVAQYYWDYLLIPNQKISCLSDRIKRIQSFDVSRFLVNQLSPDGQTRND